MDQHHAVLQYSNVISSGPLDVVCLELTARTWVGPLVGRGKYNTVGGLISGGGVRVWLW